MRENVEVLTCDLCKKTVNALRALTLPVKYYQLSDYFPVYSATDKIGLQKVDACDDCANRIATLIAEKCKTYGEFAYRGFEFEWEEGEIESEE